MRKSHTLARSNKCVMPEHIIFVDTETNAIPGDNGKTYQELMLGVTIFGRFRRDRGKDVKEIVRFKTVSQFWDIVKSRVVHKTVLHLISHNAVFDFTVLQHMKHLSKLGYKCQFVYDGGMTFISKWR